MSEYDPSFRGTHPTLQLTTKCKMITLFGNDVKTYNIRIISFSPGVWKGNPFHLLSTGVLLESL